MFEALLPLLKARVSENGVLKHSFLNLFKSFESHIVVQNIEPLFREELIQIKFTKKQWRLHMVINLRKDLAERVLNFIGEALTKLTLS